jgi:hypothetical protein
MRAATPSEGPVHRGSDCEQAKDRDHDETPI